MLTSVDVMPLLVAACSSYRMRWKQYVSSNYADGDAQLLYADLGDFASHIVEQLAAGDTREFGAVFKVVERLHLEGEPYVREAITVGLLEGLQNHAEHRGIDENRFKEWLSPESLRWWIGLQRFWLGQSATVQPVDRGSRLHEK